jgi:hypothetical protein
MKRNKTAASRRIRLHRETLYDLSNLQLVAAGAPTAAGRIQNLHPTTTTEPTNQPECLHATTTAQPTHQASCSC